MREERSLSWKKVPQPRRLQAGEPFRKRNENKESRADVSIPSQREKFLGGKKKRLLICRAERRAKDICEGGKKRAEKHEIVLLRKGFRAGGGGEIRGEKQDFNRPKDVASGKANPCRGGVGKKLSRSKRKLLVSPLAEEKALLPAYAKRPFGEGEGEGKRNRDDGKKCVFCRKGLPTRAYR